MNINGDKKLSFIENLIYTLLFINEFLNERKAEKNYFFEISWRDLYKFWKDDNILNYSPSRIATDAFLINYLTNNFDIKKKLNVLDLGCGLGVYSTYLRNLGYQLNYTGVDLNKDATKHLSIDKNNNFILGNFDTENNKIFNQLSKLNKINKFDLILSHSFLEHVEKDDLTINNLKKFFPETKQVHFVPASLSFFNYFRHGYRRYNNKKIRSMSNKPKNFYEVFKLGNHEALKQYYVRYFLYYGKKHKLDFFNLYKNKDNTIFDFKKYIYSLEKQYPIFYCLYK